MTDDGWGGWGDDPEDKKKVGYKNPPKHSRFKPGQSGNPKGRRWKKYNNKTYLEKALNETVEITENGVRRRIPRGEVIWKVNIANAMKGDARATQLLFKMMQYYRITDDLDPETQEMVIRLVRSDKDKNE